MGRDSHVQRGDTALVLSIDVGAVPDEKIDRATELEGKGINGLLIPVGDGSIAIIGEKDENLDAIQRNVTNSVTWAT